MGTSGSRREEVERNDAGAGGRTFATPEADAAFCVAVLVRANENVPPEIIRVAEGRRTTHDNAVAVVG
ncbi:MAG: hypothetical protein AAB592_00660 [Patescibacteria group bacterium]